MESAMQKPTRFEKFLDYATAVLIGLGLAGLLISWWSS